MAVFNGSRWLGEAIESILAQTYENFELIIINDGSTDDSQVIAEAFAKKDSRIIVINRRNHGLSSSLNYGIQMASGEWIARLDADDIAEPSRFQRQLEVAQTDLSIVVLGSGFSFIDENGSVTASFPQVDKNRSILNSLINGKGRVFPHSSALFKRRAALQVGGYRPRIRRSQDKDLWLRLSRLGRLESVNDVLVRIRRHTNQISHEASGYIQLVDSQIAAISYFIVNSGLSDPVDYGDEQYIYFRAWVEKRLMHYRMFAIREWQYDFQTSVSRKKFSTAFIFFMKAVMNPIMIIFYLKLRICGNAFPKQIAKEWFKII